MRCLVTILLLFIYSIVWAQVDVKDVEKAHVALNNALVNKDTTMLKQLLHDKLVYGHSNNWKESKQEVMNDLYSGILTYKSIRNLADPEIIIEGSTAVVRANAEVDILYKEKTMQLKLHSLQVWVKQKKNWVLLSRQSVKID